MQWTPELAAEIAESNSVLFVDCAIDGTPGEVRISPVECAEDAGEIATHHNDAPHLLRLCRELYGVSPRSSLLLTVGAGSTELGEGFSTDVSSMMPEACRCIERIVLEALSGG